MFPGTEMELDMTMDETQDMEHLMTCRCEYTPAVSKKGTKLYIVFSLGYVWGGFFLMYLSLGNVDIVIKNNNGPIE